MRSWGVYAAIALGAVAYNVFTKADRDESGAIVGEGTISAFQMRVGDCYQDSASAVSEDNYEVSEVRGVPCAEPHDNEVFAVFDLSVAQWPGEEQIESLADEGCRQRFTKAIGSSYEDSVLEITYLTPTEGSCKRRSDREVICAAYHMEQEKLTGSVMNSGL